MRAKAQSTLKSVFNYLVAPAKALGYFAKESFKSAVSGTPGTLAKNSYKAGGVDVGAVAAIALATYMPITGIAAYAAVCYLSDRAVEKHKINSKFLSRSI